MNSYAWNEGYLAFEKKEPLINNPYYYHPGKGTDLFTGWNNGWKQAWWDNMVAEDQKC